MTVRKKRLLTVVVSVFVIPVVGEIYLRSTWHRTVDPYSPGLYTHRGEEMSSMQGPLKLALAPYTTYKNFPSQHSPQYNINARGLRGEEIAAEDSTPKIVWVGGSAAFGLGVDTDRDTISSILEPSLRPYRMLNAGVVGFVSGQELTYLVTDLIDYRPSVVIAYDGWNDLAQSIYFQRTANEVGININFFIFEDQLVQNYQTEVNPIISLKRSVRAISDESLLLAKFREIIARARYRTPVADKTLLSAIAQTYANNMRKMAKFSASCGAKFIVVFQPELGQKVHPTRTEQSLLNTGVAGIRNYQEDFPLMYREFLTRSKQLLTEDGIKWIDINDNLKFVESDEELFRDVVHTNRRGNEIVAQIVGAAIGDMTRNQ